MNNGLTPRTWTDDNPFYLVIASEGEKVLVSVDGQSREVRVGAEVLTVDLGEAGWLTTYSDWLRKPGYWILNYKEHPVSALVVRVNPGDQPYYAARHVGMAGSGGSNEVTAYGIGKKQANGEMVRLWVMPGGAVVGGEDCDPYGVDIVKAMGPRPTP